MDSQALSEFTLENLPKLEGGLLAAQWARLLSDAIGDCVNRPTDNTPRKVTFQLSITPDIDRQGAVIECRRCHGEIEMNIKMPVRRSRPIAFGIRTKGPKNTPVLVFNQDSPDNVDQGTLFEPSGE